MKIFRFKRVLPLAIWHDHKHIKMPLNAKMCIAKFISRFNFNNWFWLFFSQTLRRNDLDSFFFWPWLMQWCYSSLVFDTRNIWISETQMVAWNSLANKKPHSTFECVFILHWNVRAVIKCLRMQTHEMGISANFNWKYKTKYVCENILFGFCFCFSTACAIIQYAPNKVSSLTSP